MSTKLFAQRRFTLLTLVAVCGFALTISGCGKKEVPRQPEDAMQQEMRKNKKDD